MPKTNWLYVNSVLLFVVLMAGTQGWAQNGGATISYAGSVDHNGCDSIAGWAADRYRADTPINIQIYDSGFLVATTTANIYRPDVGNYLLDNGLHGFSVPTPLNFKDGFQHNISVRFETSSTELSGSPQTLTCVGPPPAMTAEHYIVTGPTGGAPVSTVINHFYRDALGRTRYDDGSLATISDPVAQETILLDLLRHKYSRIPWASPNPGNDPSALPAPAVQQNLISSPFDPGPFNFFFPESVVALPLALKDTASCPALGKGYSVTTPPPPPLPGAQGVPTLVTTFIVKIWTCRTMSLPMYVAIENGGFTTFEGLRITTLGDPGAQQFIIPAGFSQDDQLAGTASGGSPCALRRTSNPLLLLSNGYHLGQGTYTALTGGMSGCTISSVSVVAGPALNVRYLTLRGTPVFHILFSDSGGSNPTVPDSDIALVYLTVSDGFTSNTVMDFALISKF